MSPPPDDTYIIEIQRPATTVDVRPTCSSSADPMVTAGHRRSVVVRTPSSPSPPVSSCFGGIRRRASAAPTVSLAPSLSLARPRPAGGCIDGGNETNSYGRRFHVVRLNNVDGGAAQWSMLKEIIRR
ncbi:hypothetical protein LSAT2_025166 [Lamellibrachia satsuma]|nr:hypothetical protein LSAT2_025166 [Lamellibrachia satsuma]